jgi:hypothetical protein
MGSNIKAGQITAERHHFLDRFSSGDYIPDTPIVMSDD